MVAERAPSEVSDALTVRSTSCGPRREQPAAGPLLAFAFAQPTTTRVRGLSSLHSAIRPMRFPSNYLDLCNNFNLHSAIRPMRFPSNYLDLCNNFNTPIWPDASSARGRFLID